MKLLVIKKDRKINKMMEFFKDTKGQKSMMRLGFASIHIIAFFIVIGITIAIVTKPAPDYSGMAILIGAVAALLGVAYAGKVKQKETEEDK